ncbi:MAG: hypothetical protein Kow0089_12120 [Desulfobulbaceae bacterium]
MMKKNGWKKAAACGTLCCLVVLAWGIAAAGTQKEAGRFYADGHGGSVYFPLGAVSFADEVVFFSPGDPPGRPDDSNPGESLGAPDFDAGADDGFLTLGCGGILVLRFDDNALVDLPGPDLHVFEIGPAIEPTELAVSSDGRTWVRVGRIEGGRADVDIAAVTSPGTVYHYVRLTDLRTACDGDFPGADIDAVGAIGSGLRIALDSRVLFDFGKYALRKEAQRELDSIVAILAGYPGAEVLVEGHTDSVGSREDNMVLSLRRAETVLAYLQKADLPEGMHFTARGYGEERPVASNETEEGRRRNRRVDVMVIPPPSIVEAGSKTAAMTVVGTWKTSWGNMVIRREGDGVVGMYDSDNGRIFAKISGGVLEGYWVEDTSSRRCGTAMHNSNYWGRLHLEFSDDGRRFTGRWGYCDGPLDHADWKGERD